MVLLIEIFLEKSAVFRQIRHQNGHSANTLGSVRPVRRDPVVAADTHAVDRHKINVVDNGRKQKWITMIIFDLILIEDPDHLHLIMLLKHQTNPHIINHNRLLQTH